MYEKRVVLKMNFDLICRVCLKQRVMKSIFDIHKTEKSRPISYAEMLNYCTTNKVSLSDGYPAHICKLCITKLCTAYNFCRLCQTSYEYLSDYIQENKGTIRDVKLEDERHIIDFMTVVIEDVKEVIDESEDNRDFKVEPPQSNNEKEDLSFKDSYLDGQFYSDKVQNDNDNETKEQSMLINKDNENTTQEEEEDMNFYSDNESIKNEEHIDNESRKQEKEKSKKKNAKDKSKYKKKDEKEKYSCRRCNKKFITQLPYLRHLDKHLLTDNPDLEEREKFTCSDCPVKFNFKKILLKHVKCHVSRKKHSVSREIMPCPHCPKKFKSKMCLKKHIDKHLGIQVNEEKMVCPYCNKNVKGMRMLLRHKAFHLGLKTYYCEKCKKSYRSEEDHKPVCSLTFSFQCNDCSKWFKRKDSLTSHVKIHDPKRKTYICDYEGCGQSFFTASGISQHKQNQHSGVKKMCHLCSKEFSDGAYLKNHIDRHNNIRRHPCSYCDRKFFTSGARQEHERRHTNTKPFACTKCEKSFVSSTSLKRHMMWHEKKFDEQCRFCEKKFLVRGNRITHEVLMHGVTRTVDESKFSCKQRIKCTRIPKVPINN